MTEDVNEPQAEIESLRREVRVLREALLKVGLENRTLRADRENLVRRLARFGILGK